MTKKELYDIINEEIVNFKKGKINEELTESDKDVIRKIIRQEVSAIFLICLRKEKLGEHNEQFTNRNKIIRR